MSVAHDNFTQPASTVPDASVRGDDAMAGDDNQKRIAVEGLTDAAVAFVAEPPGELM